MSKKALFLDRDGTIIYDVGHGHDPDGVVLLPGAKEALWRAIALGYHLFLFTNQSGIGWGYFTWEDAVACNQRMIELLEQGPELFSAICIAPERSDEVPVYRKPEPRFIHESIEAFQLDPTECFMIGDRMSDWKAGLNAGIRAVVLESGKNISAEDNQFIQEKGIPRHSGLAAFVATLNGHL